MTGTKPPRRSSSGDRKLVFIHELTPYGLAPGKAQRVRNETGVRVELSGRSVISLHVPAPGHNATAHGGTVAVLLEWGSQRLKPFMTAAELHREAHKAFHRVDSVPFSGDGQGLLIGASKEEVDVHLQRDTRVRLAPFNLNPDVTLGNHVNPLLVLTFGTTSRYKIGLETGRKDRNLERDAHLLLDVVDHIQQVWRGSPLCDTRWVDAPWVSNSKITPSDWSISSSMQRSDLRLAELLPQTKETTNPGPPVTANFFKNLTLKRSRVDPIEELKERGIDHQDLLEMSQPGAYLVVAAHELSLRQKLEGGDPRVFADALTSRNVKLISKRSAWTYRRLMETRDFVNTWIGSKGRLRWVELPQAESPEREALQQLVQAAPWITFLLTLHTDELRVPLTFAQVIEAAMIAPATAAIRVDDKIEERDASVLLGCIRLLNESLDDSTLADHIAASSQVSRRARDGNERIYQLTEDQLSRFEEVASPWVPMAETTVRDLRVFVDPKNGNGFVVNRSPEGPMTVGFPGEELILLGPHRITSECRLIGSADAKIGTSDDGPIEVSVNGKQISYDYPPQEIIELDSGASQPRISSRLFQGRENELAEIMDMVGAGPRSRQPVVIYGNRRAGKTTLALHALRSGVEQGLLSASIQLDVIDGVGADGTRAGDYAIKLSRSLLLEINSALQGTKITLPNFEESVDNPVDLLRAVDRAWPKTEPPLGLLLDEVDSLFYRAKGTALHSVVMQLGNITLKNIQLLGTVQRHNEYLGILKEWLPVNCPATLGPQEAIKYFTDALTSEEILSSVSRPMITPWTLQDVVIPRLGLRPYFWGRLYRRLETEARLTGLTLISGEVVNREIDQVSRNDQFFGSLLSSSPQELSLAEARRQDVFSNSEVTLLAQFLDAPEHTNYLTLPHIRNVFGGDLEPLDSLHQREMIRQYAEQVYLDPPLLQEWVRLHALELAPFRHSGSDSRMGPDQTGGQLENEGI